MIFKRTLKKVKDIQGEVKELHPLLDALFRKLDTVTHVEYKQGPRESGADFVVIKTDPVWNQDEYVGVVVKTGKITQNSHDVNSQIEQCATMKRTINGKKEILVNEIWVVTSSGITQNAQDFFSQKYNNYKVKFIGPELLAQMVVENLPEYFEGVSIVTNQYIQKNKEVLERLQASTKLSVMGFDGLNIQHELIFQDNKNYKNNSTRIHRSKNVTIDALISKGGVSIIEGGVGAGKSSLLRSTAISLLEPEMFLDNNRLPIYISFKEFENKYSFSLQKLIDSEVGQIHTDELKYVIMIDGIDESQHSTDDRVEIIDRIISEAETNSNIKLIMTARVTNNNSIKVKSKSNFRVYQIAPLSVKQIINIVNKACSSLNTKNRIIEDLKKSNLFKALPKTPIAAILLAKLLNENNQEIPSNLTELYSKYTEISLGRWDIDIGLTKEKEFDASEAITKNLAKYFFDNDLLVISIDEAREFFKSYLEKRKTGLNHIDLFDKITNRSELFYTDQVNNTFGFRHRTFIEFFYAKNALANDDFQITSSSFEIQWLAVSFFWVGLQKDCPDAIKKFTITEASHEREKLLKLINMGNILLAGYSTEYDTITSSIAHIFSEAGRYFHAATQKGSNTIFSNFSEMRLLALFRYILADSYGYDFFSEAIEESMMLIDDSKELTEIEKIYSLFFLETSLTTPEGDCLFSFLIEKYKGKLPVTISLGITHESRNMDIKNKHISKVMRNVRKLAQDRETKQKINFLYDKPIKHLTVK